MSKEKKGGAKKEQLKQEKRAWKKERNEKIQARKNERYATGEAAADGRYKPAGRPGKPVKKGVISKNKFKPEAAPDKGKTIQITKAKAVDNTMPLNKYIAHGGLCSRRDAAEMVKAGKVTVDGKTVTEPGFKVLPEQDVRVAGKKVTPTGNLVYILLNKPKDCVTTTDDPQKRKTVLDLVKDATPERLYPVGRLDRNTSGVLLLTNDGELSQKLTHPSQGVKKVYAVTLDKPLTKTHFNEILKGITLDDGPAPVDALAFTDAKDLTQVGIELHSGKNRIVRRIFEHLGYKVKTLDRVIFAGLTKKNVPRGKWRFLSEKEVRDLKYFNKGKR